MLDVDLIQDFVGDEAAAAGYLPVWNGPEADSGCPELGFARPVVMARGGRLWAGYASRWGEAPGGVRVIGDGGYAGIGEAIETARRACAEMCFGGDDAG